MAAVLSCIMPVYDGEEYLEKSVQSVLDQSFAWFELILVNDGSTDRTADLCAEFARKDERVRVLTQPNKGAAAARNAGIQAAEGRYITFVDADDMLLPKAFEKTVQAMENRELDLVSFNFSFCSDTGFTEAVYPAFAAASLEEFWPHFIEYYRANQFFSLCNKVYRTQLIKGLGLKLDESLRTGEDIQFNFAYFANLGKMEHLDGIYYEYWRHAQTLTRAATLDNMETSQRVLHGVRRFLEQCGQSELYPQLAAAQLPWDAVNFFDLLTDSSKPYTLEERKAGLEKLFANPMWHTALMTRLEGREGLYNGWLRKAAAKKNAGRALLPLRLKGKR